MWVTDAEGDDALEFAPATGVAPGATPRRLAAGQLGRVLGLAMAPDGSRAAVASHDGRVLLVERETGEVREVDRSEDGEVTGPGLLARLGLARLVAPRPAPAAPAQARQHRRPVGHRGDPAALPGLLARVHARRQAPRLPVRPRPSTPSTTSTSSTSPSSAAPARTSSRSPRPPRRPSGRSGTAGPSRRPTRTRPPTARAPPPPGSTSKGSPTGSCPSRSRPPATPTLRAAKDGVLWLRHPVQRRPRRLPGHARRPRPEDRPGALRPRPAAHRAPRLRRRPLRGQRRRQAGPAVDRRQAEGRPQRPARLERRRQRHQHHRRPRRASGRPSTRPPSGARCTTRPAASCGTTSGGPDLGGVDWDGVLDRYRPVLERVATHDDLVDLLWEVQGELGTSHAYVTPRGGGGAGDRGRGCSARTSPGTRTARRGPCCGASTGSCPPRPPTRTRAPRSPRPASRCAPGTRSSPSAGSRSTRWPGPARCSSARRASRSS